MTNPYPPYRTPRKLERSRSNRVLGGVCGGVADYVNMDPTLVRVLTVLISLFTGVPIIIYLIALFVIPEEGSSPTSSQSYPGVQGPQWSYGAYPQQNSEGLVPPADPGYPSSSEPEGAPAYGSKPRDEDRAVWGAAGAPWEQPQPSGWQQPPAGSQQPPAGFKPSDPTSPSKPGDE
jgi:phage shock protein PspC (stress-responsive transcriptional regulator)